jgi:hypothetical protein
LQPGPLVWLPSTRREEITTCLDIPMISEAVPGPGGARVLFLPTRDSRQPSSASRRRSTVFAGTGQSGHKWADDPN